MKIRPPLVAAALAACLPFLAGCFFGPKEPLPRPMISADRVELADDIQLALGEWPEARWWERYNDPQLDELMEKARLYSPAMAETQQIIALAETQVDALRSSFAPQINAMATIDRQHPSATGLLAPYAANFPRLGLTGPWYTAGTVGVLGSLDIDIWGKRRKSLAAVVGKRNARMAEAAVVELAINAEIAQLYFTMQTGFAMLDLLRETEEVLEFAIESRRGRAATGVDSVASIQAARTHLLAVKREIVAAQGQLTRTRETIRALVGAGADDLPDIRPAPLPRAVVAMPASLSYDLLARRPDLQALRWYVQASLSEIEVAQAAFYPSFDIKAFLGLDTIHLGNLFSRDSFQANIIPGLTLPIFNAGALRANLRGARAVNNQVVEQYNQAVLNAVREVAIGATMLRTLEEERRLQAEKVEAASVAMAAAEAKRQRGLAARTASLEARLPVITERASLLLVDGQLLTQEIALIKALGGGYAEYDELAAR